jgi:hypothetical protein
VQRERIVRQTAVDDVSIVTFGPVALLTFAWADPQSPRVRHLLASSDDVQRCLAENPERPVDALAGLRPHYLLSEQIRDELDRTGAFALYEGPAFPGGVLPPDDSSAVSTELARMTHEQINRRVVHVDHSAHQTWALNTGPDTGPMHLPLWVSVFGLLDRDRAAGILRAHPWVIEVDNPDTPGLPGGSVRFLVRVDAPMWERLYTAVRHRRSTGSGLPTGPTGQTVLEELVWPACYGRGDDVFGLRDVLAIGADDEDVE